jgi:hypothetical protein
MKFMTALAVFALSTGLAWGAAEPQEAAPPPVPKAEKKAPSPAQIAQREKMKTCNADAGKNELKGDARKKFMSECLKGGGKGDK